MNDSAPRIQQGFYRGASVTDIQQDLQRQGLQPYVIKESPDSYLDEHQHAQSHIIVVIDGTMRFTIDGNTYDMRSGDLVTVPPHTPHAAQFGTSGCTYIWVEY